MAIRNIVKEGDPILNKVCRPVTNLTTVWPPCWTICARL